MNVYGGVSINKPIIVTQNSCRHSYIHKVCLRDQHYRQDVHTHTTLFACQTKQRNILHECRVCNLYIFTHAWVHTHISVSCFKASAALCSLLHTLYTHVCPVVKKHSFSLGGFCSPNPLHSAENKVFVLFFYYRSCVGTGGQRAVSSEGIRMSLYESL